MLGEDPVVLAENLGWLRCSHLRMNCRCSLRTDHTRDPTRDRLHPTELSFYVFGVVPLTVPLMLADGLGCLHCPHLPMDYRE